MANRIPLVVVSTEQLIKELPAVDDLDLSNSSIRNVATANVGNINTTNLVVTTANATTINTTSLVVTTANVTTANLSSLTVFGGATYIEEIIEKANVTATAMGANANVDILDCAVHFYTANSTANNTLNIRGNSTVTLNSIMSVNQALTIAFVITNGASAFRVANVQLDGANTTIKWSGGSAPTACSNSTEAYAFTIIKTGAAAQYHLLGSKTQFA